MGGLFGYISRNREQGIEKQRLAQELTYHNENLAETKRKTDLENWQKLQEHAIKNLDEQLGKMSPSSPGYAEKYGLRAKLFKAKPGDEANAQLWDEYGLHHQVHPDHTDGLNDLTYGTGGKPTGPALAPPPGQTPGSLYQAKTPGTPPFADLGPNGWNAPSGFSGGVETNGGQNLVGSERVNGRNVPSVGSRAMPQEIVSSQFRPGPDIGAQGPQMAPPIQGNGQMGMGGIPDIPSSPIRPPAQLQYDTGATPPGNFQVDQSAGNRILPPAPPSAPSSVPPVPLPSKSTATQLQPQGAAQTADNPVVGHKQIQLPPPPQQQAPPSMHQAPGQDLYSRDMAQYGYTSPDLQQTFGPPTTHQAEAQFNQGQMQAGINRMKQEGRFDPNNPLHQQMEFEAYGGKAVPGMGSLYMPHSMSNGTLGTQAPPGTKDTYGRPVRPDEGGDPNTLWTIKRNAVGQEIWSPQAPQTFTAPNAMGDIKVVNKKTGGAVADTGVVAPGMQQRSTSSVSSEDTNGVKHTGSVRTVGAPQSTGVPADLAKPSGLSSTVQSSAPANIVNKHAEAVVERANKSIDVKMKPVEDRMARTSRLEEALNQGGGIGHSVAIPEFLTVMAGGTGSGLRINEAELHRIADLSRTAWEDLKTKLTRFSTNPNEPDLILSPVQVQQMRMMTQAIGQKDRWKMDLANTTRDAVSNSTNGLDHRKLINAMNREFVNIDSAESSKYKPINFNDPKVRDAYIKHVLSK